MDEDGQTETVLIARGDETAAQRCTSHGKDVKLVIQEEYTRRLFFSPNRTDYRLKLAEVQ